MRIFVVVLGVVLLIGPACLAAEPVLELVQTIPLKGKAGKLDHLVYDGKHERLLVANKANNTLDVVDVKAGKLLRQVANQQGIQGVAYAGDLNRIFVGLGVGFCNVLDGDTYAPLKTIKFADDADNVRYDPRTHLVYVAHAEKALGVIDGKTYALKADVKLPGSAEGFQIATKGTRLFLAMGDCDELVVIDTNQLAIVARHPLQRAGGGHPLAMDEAQKRIFVGCRKEPMVVALDSETGKVIASVPIPGEIDDLFYDAQRKHLYACCGEGFLAVIAQKDADHYEVVEKLPTAKDARTCVFVPELGRLFVGVPRQAGQEGPEVRVYQIKP